MRQNRSLLGPARLGGALLALGSLLTCQPQLTPRPQPVSPAGFPKPVSASRTIGMAMPPGPWMPVPDAAPPLKIVFKSPVKRATGTAAILVTFNQPMIRLGRAVSASEDSARYPIVSDPPVKAVYRWVAGDTRRFCRPCYAEHCRRAHPKVDETPIARALDSILKHGQ